MRESQHHTVQQRAAIHPSLVVRYLGSGGGERHPPTTIAAAAAFTAAISHASEHGVRAVPAQSGEMECSSPPNPFSPPSPASPASLPSTPSPFPVPSLPAAISGVTAFLLSCVRRAPALFAANWSLFAGLRAAVGLRNSSGAAERFRGKGPIFASAWDFGILLCGYERLYLRTAGVPRGSFLRTSRGASRRAASRALKDLSSIRELRKSSESPH